MTKDEMNTAIDAMLEHGDQLIPILKAVVMAIPV